LGKGIGAIGITDHNTIAGALAFRAIAKNIKVIVGEEILTRAGEIIGLFLEREIASNLDPRETCKQIKDQGGLVYVPHPFDIFKVNRLNKRALLDLLDIVDIIEVFNAKANVPACNKVAARFAHEYGKIAAAGSDAHYLEAIGMCGNQMEDFTTPQEFLQNLSQANLITKHIYPMRTWWVGIKNALRGEGHWLKRYGR
jgi:predicted metal-dependent phosphoesterase TrpH